MNLIRYQDGFCGDECFLVQLYLVNLILVDEILVHQVFSI